MKKKIGISVFLVIFILINMFSINTYAATSTNNFAQITIPDSYEEFYEDISDEYAYGHYMRETNESYSAFYYSVDPKWNDKETFTQNDLTEKVNEIMHYPINGDSVKILEKELIEINGCKGMRVAYKYWYASEGVADYNDEYCFITDNYIAYLTFYSSDENYINSTEQRQILNSFKIKDTVLKSRGIPFTDVATGIWYETPVRYAYKNNIMSGVGAYTFAPDTTLTRGMLVTMLYRMDGMPYVGGTSKFSDVQNVKAYYYEPVKWASANEIVSGYGNGTFAPDKPITREELAVMLNNYCKYEGKYKTVYADYSKFSDANKISEFAKWGMNWAVGSGIISGNEETKTLNPQGQATRAEAITMIYNYSQRIK